MFIKRLLWQVHIERMEFGDISRPRRQKNDLEKMLEVLEKVFYRSEIEKKQIKKSGGKNWKHLKSVAWKAVFEKDHWKKNVVKYLWGKRVDKSCKEML